MKKELLHLQNFEIFACDEVGLQLNTLTRRAWLQKGKELREILGKLLKRVHLINLASYAPDTNPIEHKWNKAKDRLSGRLGKGIEKVRNEFHSFITFSNCISYYLVPLFKLMPYDDSDALKNVSLSRIIACVRSCSCFVVI